MAREVEWVVLRRFDDGIEAEMARDFLEEHDVRVALRGNSGATAVLNRFDTVLDVRLVVPKDELEHAREVLAALHPPPDAVIPEPPDPRDLVPGGAPYRATALQADEAPVRKRYRRAAFILAFAVPIGAGHFYARHDVAGALLACGIVGSFVAGLASGAAWLTTAALVLVAIDAVFGARAVGRYNDGDTPTDASQAVFAVVALVGALVTAALLA